VLALRRLARVARGGGAAGRGVEVVRAEPLSWRWTQQDWRGQVIACQGLGNLCDDRGERERARDWYERGLRLAREAEDAALQWPFYANLSVLALLEGELEAAERLLARARACIEESGAGGAMRFWLNNRGLLLLEHGDAAAAEAVFREALHGERTRSGSSRCA
jgi:tetratricopeptide (TPR) repeat protein